MLIIHYLPNQINIIRFFHKNTTFLKLMNLAGEFDIFSC